MERECECRTARGCEPFHAHIRACHVKPFKRTYIEITNACNLSCTFCPGTSRRVEFMDTGLFESIVAKLGARCTHLYFHVLGEPLLHPALPEFLDIAYRRGKLVNLTTNGTLIGSAGAALLEKPAVRQVTFSLHSFAAAGKRSVEDYVGPIIDFARTARARHLVSLRLWNEDEPDDTGTCAALLEIIKREFPMWLPARRKSGGNLDLCLDKNIFLNPVARFSWPDPNGPDCGTTGYCLALREQIAILVDGTAVPCCLDRNGAMALGNIKGQTMDQIILSDRARRIHNGFSKRQVVEPLCRHCSYRLRFSRQAPPAST
jgi:radical SAM protein with 4Fe4S-binding SPASM domain